MLLSLLSTVQLYSAAAAPPGRDEAEIAGLLASLAGFCQVRPPQLGSCFEVMSPDSFINDKLFKKIVRYRGAETHRLLGEVAMCRQTALTNTQAGAPAVQVSAAVSEDLRPTCNHPGCGKIFASKFSLSLHKRVHSKEKSKAKAKQKETKVEELKLFGCRTCLGTFETSYDIIGHLVLRYKDCKGEVNSLDKVSRYYCTQCPDKKFTIDKLREHAYSHNPDLKPHSCSICEFKFSGIQHLKDHKCSGKSGHMVECKGCYKYFNTAQGATRHRKFCLGGIVSKDGGAGSAE